MNISKKKPSFKISEQLRNYLKKYDREESIPIKYDDLLYWSEAFPVFDSKGEDTFWRSVIYPPTQQVEIEKALTQIYGILKTGGNMDVIGHLRISRIDYCEFGNSNPFRIRIINTYNDNHDYFYIKKEDATRVYGLELEHILSPNRIEYITHENTIVEGHIMGIPGDIFIDYYMDQPNFFKVGMAKEFVKFNERCFVMLLGDMRSYNYVVNVTPDFDKEQYRVRTIDFDQLCYEGRRDHYLPQFYKENEKIVNFCSEVLSPKTVFQYQYEERMLIKKRYFLARNRLNNLLMCLSNDTLSKPEKIKSLCEDLNKYHQSNQFNNLKKMGQVLKLHLKLMLEKPKPTHFTGKLSFKSKK